MHKSVYPHFPQSLNKQIDYIFDTTVGADWTLKDVNNNTIITGTDVLLYIYDKYMFYKSQSPIEYLWSQYKLLSYADFLKAWSAWQAEYNPLENYNGEETTVRQKMDGETTETVTHGKTVTHSLGVNGVETETTSTSADDTSFRNVDKTTQKGTTSDADSGTTTTVTDTDTKSLTIGSDTYTADYVEGETRKRHGNLGITTSQQMIQSEVEMRMNPLIMMYIDNFVRQYCYYIGGAFDYDVDFL